jgi:hypothetical protein
MHMPGMTRWIMTIQAGWPEGAIFGSSSASDLTPLPPGATSGWGSSWVDRGKSTDCMGGSCLEDIEQEGDNLYQTFLKQPVNDLSDLFHNPSEIRGAIGAIAPGIAPEIGGLGALRQAPVVSAGAVASDGRLGSAATRAQNAAIAASLESQGHTIIGGGGRLAEEYIPGVGPGTKGSTYVDITAINSTTGTVTRVQTIDTLVNGSPTAREAAAAARIRAAFPSDILKLVPKK